MKITEKCKVIVASSLVAALMTGTALPALAASPAGDGRQPRRGRSLCGARAAE